MKTLLIENENGLIMININHIKYMACLKKEDATSIGIMCDGETEVRIIYQNRDYTALFCAFKKLQKAFEQSDITRIEILHQEIRVI